MIKENEELEDFIQHNFHRSLTSMYIEWYLHNVGYYLTLPFMKIRFIAKLNERFKHVDLEEYNYE